MSSNLTSPVLLVATAAALASSVAIVYSYQKQKLAAKGRDCNRVTITLPGWTNSSDYWSRLHSTDEEMMALAISLSARNIAEKTGGPFGCAIFERRSEDNKCTLVSIGVNQVVPLGNSTLHGEIVAIQLAQSKLNTYTLQLADTTEPSKIRRFELFTSCEPCCMCLGAILWSGVSRVVCGATKSDASAIGFNEGPVFDESYEHLRQAGVEVQRGVLREEAAEVLKKYGKTGLIYNR